VPQSHDPGDEREVDFGEFHAEIDGTMTKCHLFKLRLAAFSKGASVAFTNQGQEAFMEGHVCAFEQLGGAWTDSV
jgi:transposase